MGIEGYYEDYFDERQDEKLTNFEKIKQMSLDEMAEFINAIEFCADTNCTAEDCFIKKNGMEKLCRLTSYYSSGAKQWLEEESEE